MNRLVVSTLDVADALKKETARKAAQHKRDLKTEKDKNVLRTKILDGFMDDFSKIAKKVEKTLSNTNAEKRKAALDSFFFEARSLFLSVEQHYTHGKKAEEEMAQHTAELQKRMNDATTAIEAVYDIDYSSHSANTAHSDAIMNLHSDDSATYPQPSVGTADDADEEKEDDSKSVPSTAESKSERGQRRRAVDSAADPFQNVIASSPKSKQPMPTKQRKQQVDTTLQTLSLLAESARTELEVHRRKKEADAKDNLEMKWTRQLLDEALVTPFWIKEKKSTSKDKDKELQEHLAKLEDQLHGWITKLSNANPDLSAHQDKSKRRESVIDSIASQWTTRLESKIAKAEDQAAKMEAYLKMLKFDDDLVVRRSSPYNRSQYDKNCLQLWRCCLVPQCWFEKHEYGDLSSDFSAEHRWREFVDIVGVREGVEVEKKWLRLSVVHNDQVLVLPEYVVIKKPRRASTFPGQGRGAVTGMDVIVLPYDCFHVEGNGVDSVIDSNSGMCCRGQGWLSVGTFEHWLWNKQAKSCVSDCCQPPHMKNLPEVQHIIVPSYRLYADLCFCVYVRRVCVSTPFQTLTILKLTSVWVGSSFAANGAGSTSARLSFRL